MSRNTAHIARLVVLASLTGAMAYTGHTAFAVFAAVLLLASA